MAQLAPQRWEDHYTAGRGFAPVTDTEFTAWSARLGEPAGRSLLDLGCGTGELTRRLHRAGFTALGADLSATAVKVARQDTDRDGPAFTQFDADRDSIDVLPAARFEVITCRLVWVFLGAAGRARAASLLAPGGVLCVLTPVREHLTRRPNTGMPEQDITDLQAGFTDCSRTDMGPLALLALRTPDPPPAGRLARAAVRSAAGGPETRSPYPSPQ
jgi:SAM-dependent methyltransferase